MSDRAAHAAQLREVRQRRLDVLELQAGELGSSTPPHILTEIEQLKVDLATLTVMDTPPNSKDVKDLLRRYDAIDLLTQIVGGLVTRLSELEQAFIAFQAERKGQIAKDEAERGKWRLVTNACLVVITASVLYLVFR